MCGNELLTKVRELNFSFATALLAVSGMVLTGCASMPLNDNQIRSYALNNTGETLLGRAFQELVTDQPDRSGFLLLSEGIDAFAARATLIKAAEKNHRRAVLLYSI